MFGAPEYPKSLDEALFNTWLENGRLSKIGYKYLMVVWDGYESAYQPVYAEHREQITDYHKTSGSQERLVAAYDLYSESRIV